ncbi:MAG: Nif3-like dinuclear metal center hexameric protein [Oscillospiraceae bacterium]|jgi:dinuclear metal center YbgI/SA1388 family protein|nr:Nif3-like dinuclear metal center hexameric protein [Oscillospiraceae bacterium]
MMYTVGEIEAVLESFAPAAWAKDVFPEDNAGFLLGRREAPVSRVLVALDADRRSVEEAVAREVQLLVTHHPVTFGTRRITGETEEGARLLTLAEHKIAALCMHTNWDAAPGGVSEVLARAVGLVPPYEILGARFVHTDGRAYGLGRVGRLPAPCPPDRLAEQVRVLLRCPGVRFTAGGRPSHLVAVGSGASGGQFDDVLRHGCDTFITGDVKHSLFLTARACGVTLIDAGHFHTEHPIVASVAARLRRALPDLTVLESEAVREPAVWRTENREDRGE